MEYAPPAPRSLAPGWSLVRPLSLQWGSIVPSLPRYSGSSVLLPRSVVPDHPGKVSVGGNGDDPMAADGVAAAAWRTYLKVYFKFVQDRSTPHPLVVSVFRPQRDAKRLDIDLGRGSSSYYLTCR